jgi:hypothetical protein
MPSSGHTGQPEDPRIFRAQLVMLVGFSCFAALVITWIGRLIYISWVLADVFSASIGIALVAVPIFVGLAIIFNYVFWGLHRGRQQGHPSAH